MIYSIHLRNTAQFFEKLQSEAYELKMTVLRFFTLPDFDTQEITMDINRSSYHTNQLRSEWDSVEKLLLFNCIPGLVYAEVVVVVVAVVVLVVVLLVGSNTQFQPLSSRYYSYATIDRK